MTKQELATKIWATANELRKNIKASEYKDYILGFMFYKYLCDKEIDYLTDLGGEIEDLREVDEDTKNKFKDGLGYYISYKDLFHVWKESGVNLGAKDVSEALDSFYLNLNGRYKTVFDKVFSALQTGLSKLGENSGSRDKAVRDIIDLVDLIPPTSRNFDVLGYIYEYLIQQFSSEAKKDGAFYTPHEVTSLMARIVAERFKGRDEICCYDPTVGSGGLLLNIGKEAKKYITADQIKYYGQELISETAQLAKMNLFMQGIPVQNINMRNANTLEEDWPYFDEQTAYAPLYVDVVVSNPPYSAHYEPEEHITDERFKGYGLAPAGKADLAFLLHCLYHIKNDGVMAIVLPHGVLFRGDSEGEIRKNLILNHNIETIISLPSQMFFSTSIPVIVMILSKNRKEDDILFIDASRSFKKEKKQSVLRERDVQRIFDTVIARSNVPHYAHLASMEEIKANDYNLNVPRYITAALEETHYDVFSVMTGKVSEDELDAFADIWSKFPNLKEQLLIASEGYNAFASVDIKKTVFENEKVKEYLSSFYAKNEVFREYLIKALINKEAEPSIYNEIVTALFNDFSNVALIDVYDIFQAFVDNWGIIDADLARLTDEGWKICNEIEPNMITKKDNKTKKIIEEQKGWKGKVMPFDLVKRVYFSEDYDEMSILSREADSYASEYSEIWESLDEDVRNCICKQDEETVYDIKKFKPAIKNGLVTGEAKESLLAMIDLLDKEKSLRKHIKKIEATLNEKAMEKIKALTDEEVRDLLKRKWITPVVNGINASCDNVISNFISAFEKLREKYADPLSVLSEGIENANALLKSSIGELTGNDKDNEAIKMLMEEL